MTAAHPALLVAVASAHALVARLARTAVLARLDLNGVQRAVIAVTAVVGAAGNSAADIRVGILLAHGNCLLEEMFCHFGRN